MNKIDAAKSVMMGKYLLDHLVSVRWQLNDVQIDKNLRIVNVYVTHLQHVVE
jgi:hypothetical protein